MQFFKEILHVFLSMGIWLEVYFSGSMDSISYHTCPISWIYGQPLPQSQVEFAKAIYYELGLAVAGNNMEQLGTRTSLNWIQTSHYHSISPAYETRRVWNQTADMAVWFHALLVLVWWICSIQPWPSLGLQMPLHLMGARPSAGKKRWP